MQFVRIGKVHSPQGVRGQIFVHIFAGEAAWAERWDQLYLTSGESLTPEIILPIKNWREHAKQGRWGFVLDLENIQQRNDIENLKGLIVLVPEDFLVAEEGDGLFLREVLDFEVVDQNRGLVGRVKGFSGNDFQDLLVIQHTSGEEFLVPFVDPLIIEIDKEGQKILMSVPEGLVPGEEL